MKRVLPALVLLGTTLGIGATLAAAPASADSYCASGHVCMWEEPEFGADRWVDQAVSSNGNYEIDWWDGDNEISSLRNNTPYTLKVSDGDIYPGDLGTGWNTGGESICIAPYAYVPDLDLSHNFDERAESFSTGSGC